MSNSDQNVEPWFQTQIIRTRMTIEHETPYERRFTEEIQLINNGVSVVTDFPLPLTEFKHGLEVIDEDGSFLSFYPRGEVDNIITRLETQLIEQIETLLEEKYLLWIRFPDSRGINPTELRTIRLTYFNDENSKHIKSSIFDIPLHVETIGKSPFPSETFYFIKAPKGFVIEVDKKHTKITDDHTKQEIVPEYLDGHSSPTDFKNSIPNIKNRTSFISARFPAKNNPYKILLHYKVKLSKLERWIWRTLLPLTGLMLLCLIIAKIIMPSNTYLSQNVLLGIGGGAITISGAVITLLNNPLIKRTRILLAIHVTLAIILILLSGIAQTTPTNPEG